MKSSCTTQPGEHLREAVPGGLDGTAEAGRRRRRQVDAADFCNSRTLDTLSAEYLRLTGPFSNCYHDPQDPRHRIQVTVKGNLPLEADFQKWGLGRSPGAARRLGHAGQPQWHGRPGQRSAQGDVQLGHPRRLADDRGSRQDDGKQCPDPRDSENTTRLRRRGQLHRRRPAGRLLDGLGTALARRPHDRPVRPALLLDTLLSDGKVDAGDAPMPAAQIDVTIKDNKCGDKTDIGGVGYLDPSSKGDVYSRDGTASTPRNGAQPLRAVLLAVHPGDTRPVDALGSPYGAVPPSGIDGSGDTDGYGGFLVKGAVPNWSFAWPKSRYASRLGVPVLADPAGPGRSLPPAPARHQLRLGLHGRGRRGQHQLRAGPRDVLRQPRQRQQEPEQRLRPRGRRPDRQGAGQRRRPLSVPARHVSGDGCRPGHVHGPQPVPEDAHRVLEGRRPEQHRLELGRQDRPRTRAGHRRLAARLRAGLLDGRQNARASGCSRATCPLRPTRIRTRSSTSIRARPAHDLPGSVGHRSPLHVHGHGATRRSRSTTRARRTVDVIAEFVNEGILRDTLVASRPRVGQTTIDDTCRRRTGDLARAVAAAAQPGRRGSASGPVIAAKPAITTIKSQQAKQVKKVLHKIRFAKVVTPFHGKAKLQVRVNGKAGLVKLGITIVKQREDPRGHPLCSGQPADHGQEPHHSGEDREGDGEADRPVIRTARPGVRGEARYGGPPLFRPLTRRAPRQNASRSTARRASGQEGEHANGPKVEKAVDGDRRRDGRGRDRRMGCRCAGGADRRPVTSPRALRSSPGTKRGSRWRRMRSSARRRLLGSSAAFSLSGRDA